MIKSKDKLRSAIFIRQNVYKKLKKKSEETGIGLTNLATKLIDEGLKDEKRQHES